MDDAVRELAREAGIANEWIDAADKPQRVSVESLRSVLAALDLSCATESDIAESRARLHKIAGSRRSFFTATAGRVTPLAGLKPGTAELILEDGNRQPIALRAQNGFTFVPPIGTPGYHRLRIADREITLAVAPQRCVTFNDIAPGEKLWGLGVQLYALRRERDGGFGDTAALRGLVASAAREGADAIALSPTHSLFAADSAHYGPYSPSNRLFLNPIYADSATVFGEARIDALARDEPAQTPPAVLIDWPKVAAAKYALLRRLYDDFAANELQTGHALATDFQFFVRNGGERLREHALFEALHRRWLAESDPTWSWRDWPPEWRAPTASAAANFAAAVPQEIQFHMFLQWIAAYSFAVVQDDARRKGMRIGLISDVAVGINPGGSHAWSRPHDLLMGLSVGAPPDPFNARGQDWGLTAFSPQALISSGYEPFIATLRTAMRNAGGVRIDHAMGLTRLWLVPRGASPIDGVYLSYPIDDMLRLIALESYRHRAIVIGEDLGTVQPEFRERMAETGIAGMDVLWFQRDKKFFLPPAIWRRDAVAMTSTHDLPTVAGWWNGADIATRAKLCLADEPRETEERSQDRTALWSAFRHAGVAETEEPSREHPAPAVSAAIAFTAQSPAQLALIPIEDVLGLTEQPNLPGTIEEHPNWRRRLDTPVSKILDAPQSRARLKILRERR